MAFWHMRQRGWPSIITLSENSQMKGHTHNATYTEYSESIVTERQVGMAKGPGQWDNLVGAGVSWVVMKMF